MIRVTIKKVGDFYHVKGGLKRNSKMVSTMSKTEAKRIAAARKRLIKKSKKK